PFMNRKTQCFALAGKCGGLAASGLVAAAFDSRESRSSRARLANPPPAWNRNPRRSIGIDELVQVKEHATHLLERLPFQKIQHRGGFRVFRGPRQRETPGVVDLLFRIGAGLFAKTLRKVTGLAVYELAIEQRQGLRGYAGVLAPGCAAGRVAKI